MSLCALGRTMISLGTTRPDVLLRLFPRNSNARIGQVFRLALTKRVRNGRVIGERVLILRNGIPQVFDQLKPFGQRECL